MPIEPIFSTEAEKKGQIHSARGAAVESQVHRVAGAGAPFSTVSFVQSSLFSIASSSFSSPFPRGHPSGSSRMGRHEQRLRTLRSHVAARRAPRVIVCGFCQEVSTFNPVPSTIDDFLIKRGEELLKGDCAGFGYCKGGLPVFETHGCALVPTYDATAAANGVLAHSEFEKISSELLASVRAAVADGGGIDGVFFLSHGAAQTSEDNDPEGYLFEEVRKIIGPDVPMVGTFDLHGIVTGKVLRALDMLAAQHTYPHVDMIEVGARAAQRLCDLMDARADSSSSSPPLPATMVRVQVPALVRGDNMVTAPHANPGYVDGLMSRIIALEEGQEGILSADLFWSNPFTDVPELGCQVLIAVEAGNAAAELVAREAALEIARDFWAGRSLMQAELMPVRDAVEEAKGLVGKGTVIFTDAADATSSGATGNGPTILAECLARGYSGRLLVPLVDPSLVAAAFDAGVGGVLTAQAIGGSVDPRYEPLIADCVVESLADGEAISRRWTWGNPGRCAVLRTGKYPGSVVVCVIELPKVLMTDDVFLGLGQNPRDFDAVVIKTPHAEPEMFDDWAIANFGCDAPGATSADVSSLGHTIARRSDRPLYPMDVDLEYVAEEHLAVFSLGEFAKQLQQTAEAVDAAAEQ
jgi:microcystin degradation protein MlrC